MSLDGLRKIHRTSRQLVRTVCSARAATNSTPPEPLTSSLGRRFGCATSHAPVCVALQRLHFLPFWHAVFLPARTSAHGVRGLRRLRPCDSLRWGSQLSWRSRWSPHFAALEACEVRWWRLLLIDEVHSCGAGFASGSGIDACNAEIVLLTFGVGCAMMRDLAGRTLHGLDAQVLQAWCSLHDHFFVYLVHINSQHPRPSASGVRN